jgi:hypothetical protein
MPVLCRRMFNQGIQESVDISRGRVHLKNGMRAYTFPNPLVDGPDGMPDLSKDNISGTHEGLPMVCAPDAPEGRMVIGRSPNTNSSEMLEVWNRHMPKLMEHKGQGRVYFGADAGEIIGQLNDGDMDDLLFVFRGEEYLAKFRQMHYPVELLEGVSLSRTQSAHHRLNRARWEGIASRWTPNVFFQQLKAFERGSESLGSFINRGWIDTLLSGEHRIRAVRTPCAFSSLAMVFGVYKDAAGDGLRPARSMTVIPQPQETISIPVLNQIQGIDEQLTLVTIALKAAVTRVVKLEPVPEALAGREFTDEEIDQEANERLMQYVKAARAEVERRKLLDAGIDPETVLSPEQEREVAVFREFGPDGLQGEQAPVPDAESWNNERVA